MSDKKKKKQREDAPPYELSRYVPAIKKIGEVPIRIFLLKICRILLLDPWILENFLLYERI
jgi:hypothetical protein